MKTISLHNIKGMMSVVALWIMTAALVLTSCSDDELVKTPLSQTSITEGAKTVSTLNFSWQPVEGATQYAYELKEKDSGTLVLGGMTSTTTLLATRLKPNTAYQMTVWAYAALAGDKTTSPKITIDAVTNQVMPLATPDNVQSQWGGGVITITWPEVQNASAYEYTYVKNGETITGTTPTNLLTLSALPVGEYTVYLRALSSDENYSDSQPVTFSFEREKSEIWRQQCNYYSTALDKDFACEVIAFDDGNFELHGLYGSEDVLEFGSDADSEMVILNAYYVAEPNYYYVKAGDYVLCIYYDKGETMAQCSEYQGTVEFYVYLYDIFNNYISEGYDTITWGQQGPIPIDDLVGEYTETTSCLDYTFDFATWTPIENAMTDVSIKKIDNETIAISNFYDSGDDITAKVDFENRTITIDNTILLGGYYNLADYESQDKPVVATFDENYTIRIDNWTLWYGGYQYVCNASSTLTRK